MNRARRAVSWPAVADAIGHCLLVFVFAPPLIVLPGWLRFEATNALNLEDPIVLSFVLLRGFKAIVPAFYDGVVAGVLSGCIAGVLICAVVSSGTNATRWRAWLLGAGIGLVAACLMIVAVAVIQGAPGQAGAWNAGAIAFELATGLVCGALAAPTAVRLLADARQAPA